MLVLCSLCHSSLFLLIRLSIFLARDESMNPLNNGSTITERMRAREREREREEEEEEMCRKSWGSLLFNTGGVKARPGLVRERGTPVEASSNQ